MNIKGHCTTADKKEVSVNFAMFFDCVCNLCGNNNNVHCPDEQGKMVQCFKYNTRCVLLNGILIA